MKMKTFILAAMLIFTPAAALAGGGHDHGHGHSHAEISKAKAETIASERVASLVKSGKIDKSWSSVAPSSAETKEYGGHPEWVVIFNNDTIADKSKQRLYIFLSITGEFLAANYTGN